MEEKETDEGTFTPEKFKVRHIPSLLALTFKRWAATDPARLSAIIAYYAVLSLPALLVIVVNSVGSIWGVDAVTGRLSSQIEGIVGADTASIVQEMIASTQLGGKSTVATVIGIGTLIFGATGVFYHLKISLNEIWELKMTENIGWFKLVKDRLISFGFVLVLGFLLLVSFVLTAALSILSEYIKEQLPDVILYLAFGLDWIISISVISLLFALIFRYLPDAKIKWKSVWVGAFLTALLFVLGEVLLGLYFGATDPGSTYGAAGSIILILLWVSYSCLIFFFGAEFTKVFSIKYGYGISPNESFSRVKKKEVIVDKHYKPEESPESKP
ncbi:YihY/virulence factor BrkB family protein [Algoriphagus machipongonensis]|uniref:Serum resistance protein n=1 Tax=Algoriphagus machipongonensis TaxID=388413 RepID=A3HSH2_9BACT|nr:YihY/virulence factor BrkB family protein [Algoriphagus machipongonensis]EAZ82790.1 serum resistance protein [Algoriphagus machipongonensis]